MKTKVEGVIERREGPYKVWIFPRTPHESVVLYTSEQGLLVYRCVEPSTTEEETTCLIDLKGNPLQERMVPSKAGICWGGNGVDQEVSVYHPEVGLRKFLGYRGVDQTMAGHCTSWYTNKKLDPKCPVGKDEHCLVFADLSERMNGSFF